MTATNPAEDLPNAADVPPFLENAVRSLGSGPLTEAGVQRHIAPLFSRVLHSNDSAPAPVYLKNHSLGRPLDRVAEDVREALDLWYSQLHAAWDPWLAEREAFRARIATLLGVSRPDCILPVPSAGEGLRTVLNALPGTPRVLSTEGEFDSIQVILESYAAAGRITLRRIPGDSGGDYAVEALIAALASGTDLVVLSHGMFQTGQIVGSMEALAAACHHRGARLLLDAYHTIGVIPIDAQRLDVDFLIGGSYKYLRGGPGSAFLYLSPDALVSGLHPLDAGWFALRDDRPAAGFDVSALRAGGDALLSDTPAVAPWYQARSGQQFTLALGVERLRAYSLQQLCLLRSQIEAEGVLAVSGADDRHGAFVTVRHPKAQELVNRLKLEHIVADARGEYLRLSPDCLTRAEELHRAAPALGEIFRNL
jgi:kynureninase